MKLYTMPRPEVGDIVFHVNRVGAEPAAAIITEVFERTVSLNIFAPHQYNMVPMAAVRHLADPEEKSADYEGGWWYFRPDDDLMRTLLAEYRERLLVKNPRKKDDPKPEPGRPELKAELVNT